jgi:hypothetical protein
MSGPPVSRRGTARGSGSATSSVMGWSRFLLLANPPLFNLSPGEVDDPECVEDVGDVAARDHRATPANQGGGGA